MADEPENDSEFGDGKTFKVESKVDELPAKKPGDPPRIIVEHRPQHLHCKYYHSMKVGDCKVEFGAETWQELAEMIKQYNDSTQG